MTKKKGFSDIVSGAVVFILMLFFVGLIFNVFAMSSRTIELKKSIERVVDRYQYVMESNGGLDATNRSMLIADLEAIDGVQSGGVTLSGSAVTNYPVTFNQNVTLSVSVTCDIWTVQLGTGWGVSFNQTTGTTTVNRTCLSKGVN